MSILPWIVFSRARWIPIRTRNETMDREVYLGNDHFIDYRIQERTTGKFTTGLGLTASLSLNPTGSAATASWFGPPTTSFQSHSFSTSSVTQTSESRTFTESIITYTSQSIHRINSGSNSGMVQLTASLTEDPINSGQYIATIPGANIDTVLSSSFSESFTTEFSSSITTGSFSGSFSGSVTLSFAVTMSITGLTSSLTTSVDIPLAGSSDRGPGVFEIITSGSFLKASTPMTLRSVRFLS